jgi:hypothetical protein
VSSIVINPSLAAVPIVGILPYRENGSQLMGPARVVTARLTGVGTAKAAPSSIVIASPRSKAAPKALFPKPSRFRFVLARI